MSNRIIIVDDHPLFRSALRQTLEGADTGMAFQEAGDIEGLTKALESNRNCDLVLLDLNMPGVRGFSGLMYLRAQYPSVPVVVVSANDDPVVIRRCMDFGASGVIPKTLDTEDMRAAITRVLKAAGGAETGAARLELLLAGVKELAGRWGGK